MSSTVVPFQTNAQVPIVMVVAGTRPEVIKLAPVIAALRRRPQQVDCHVVLTGQHEALADDMARLFGLTVTTHLHEMRSGDSLPGLVARVLADMALLIAEVKPDLVLVHGDTATTVASALAAFYDRVPVGHVEAGLRTHALDNPFPEEGNRSLVARIASLNFAPTETARDALLAEGIADSSVAVTGNTVVDALYMAQQHIAAGAPLTLPPLAARHTLLVTMHRRESWGEGLSHVCGALRRLIRERADIEIVLPVHPGPAVHDTIIAELSDLERLHLVAPMDYLSLVALLQRCRLVITDSGGLQEEALALHRPVLVMRDQTERQEAIEAGGAILVGTDPERILLATNSLLDNDLLYIHMCQAHNPFGDGQSGERIAQLALEFIARQAPAEASRRHA